MAKLSLHTDSRPDQLVRLLVAYDFSSASENALEHAVRLARRHQATVRVLHVSRSSRLVTRTRDAEKCLHDIARRYHDHATDIEWRVVPGDPELVLRKEIASWNPDVCFLGAYGEDSSGRGSIGRTVSALLHTLPCVVVVIGPNVSFGINATGTPAKLVCAIDFPRDIQHRLRLFAALCTRLQSTADLVHVVDVRHELSRPHSATDIQYTFDSLVAQLYLDRVLAKSTLLYGTPPDSITRYAAEKGATYILFGLHKEGKGSSYFADSLVEKVIRNAPCAVMVFPQIVRSASRVAGPQSRDHGSRARPMQPAQSDPAAAVIDA